MPQTRIPKNYLDLTLVDTTSSQALTGKTYNGVNLTTTGDGTKYLGQDGNYSSPPQATANALATATGAVFVNTATAPTTGQVLTALGPTSANWQTPSAGSGGGGIVGYQIGKKITTWYPLNTSSGTVIQNLDRGLVGPAGVVSGTVTNLSGNNKNYANLLTRFSSYRYTSAAAAGSLAGISSNSSEAALFRGSNVNEGGFQAYFRFSLPVFTSTNNLFIGLTTNQPYAFTTASSISYTNALMLGKDPGDATLSLITNNGINATDRTKTATGIAVSNTSIYEFFITLLAGGSSVEYKLIESAASGSRLTLFTTTVATTLPAASTYLFPIMAIGTAAGTTAIQIQFYGAEFTSDN